MEKSPELANESAFEIVQRFGFELNGKLLDLRNHDNHKILEFFNALAETGKYVFHGTNSKEQFDKLEARQANDTSKESGNKKAVYADANPTIPLGAALLNTGHLKGEMESFTTGWSNDDGKVTFILSPNAYERVASKDHDVMSDGYVYVLDKTHFVNAEDARDEWHSEIDQEPILSCVIPRKMADEIYVLNHGEDDTVSKYTLAEMERMEDVRKRRETHTADTIDGEIL